MRSTLKYGPNKYRLHLVQQRQNGEALFLANGQWPDEMQGLKGLLSRSHI